MKYFRLSSGHFRLRTVQSWRLTSSKSIRSDTRFRGIPESFVKCFSGFYLHSIVRMCNKKFQIRLSSVEVEFHHLTLPLFSGMLWKYSWTWSTLYLIKTNIIYMTRNTDYAAKKLSYLSSLPHNAHSHLFPLISDNSLSCTVKVTNLSL